MLRRPARGGRGCRSSSPADAEEGGGDGLRDQPKSPSELTGQTAWDG